LSAVVLLTLRLKATVTKSNFSKANDNLTYVSYALGGTGTAYDGGLSAIS